MSYTITEKDLSYVRKIIQKVFKTQSSNILYADVVSVGYEALMRAVSDFDVSKNTHIDTLIYRYVVWEVNQLLRKNYAKSFLEVYPFSENELIDNQGDCLTFLENRETTAEAIAVIHTFPLLHIQVFTAWVRGDTPDSIQELYSISETTMYRITNGILAEVNRCLMS